jgi:hypothetical protein
MDLIAQGIGAILAFLVGVVGNIFAHDICASADLICTKIIKRAARRLAAFDQNSTEQEWLADLQERQTVTEKYRHAVGCFLAAPKMRRFALKTPFVGEAPGLVWRRRRRLWEARWKASPGAIAKRYPVKSVKLWSGHKTNLCIEEKDFIVDVTRQLQAEQFQWLHDHR